MTPVTAAMGISSRPATSPRFQSPSSRWADAGDPDSQQKHTVIQRFSCPPRCSDRPFNTIMGNSAGITLRTNSPAAPLTASSTVSESSSSSAASPNSHAMKLPPLPSVPPLRPCPRRFFLKLPDLVPFFPPKTVFFQAAKQLMHLDFPSFPARRENFVSKSSQFMQQNVTLLRHTICEVIAWQRF